METDPPPFDQERARQLLGKHVIIGLTYIDHDENEIERIQRHGTVVRADESGIIIIDANSGEEITLPPDPSAFQEAQPGDYRFRTTGEIISDPDFLTQWTIRRPPPEAAATKS